VINRIFFLKSDLLWNNSLLQTIPIRVASTLSFLAFFTDRLNLPDKFRRFSP
jgi:hypothetical protein